MRAADIAESFWDVVFDLGDRLADGLSELWERFGR